MDCKAGHPLDAENSYVRPGRGPQCKECRLQATREWRARGGTPKVRPTPLGRLAERCEVSSTLFWNGTACVIWTGPVNDHGYGVFNANGKSHLAHRFSYEAKVRQVPDGLELDHLCRVRRCVNEDHLEPVTNAENVRRGDAGKFHSAKAHCPQRHPYAGDNLIVKDGKRQCRACRILADKVRYERIKLITGRQGSPSPQSAQAG
ncbi:MAG: HNH endonuclease [Acidobacteriota bacterium]|nr:HNH endonuclease [Acidobacteriota bacterium]